MYVFTNTIIHDVVSQMQTPSVLEVGVDLGYSSRLLESLIESKNGSLQVIDPFPKAELSQKTKLYRSLSLEVLDSIEPVELALIDGDHNWYTVFNELKMLEATAKNWETGFPLVFAHDVGWPYGRRDMYYDPSNIPQEFLNENKQIGINVDDDQISEKGINGHLHNSIQSGGERNGVLKAIEDFVAESSEELTLKIIPGFHGLGILYSKQFAERNPKVIETIQSFLPSENLRKLMEEAEKDRLKKLEKVSQLARTLKETEELVQKSREKYEKASNDILTLKARIQALSENVYVKTLKKFNLLER